MSSNSSVAVIQDAGRFGGVVTLEDIRRALSSDDIEAAHGNV
jgi:CBS domain-containing protein